MSEFRENNYRYERILISLSFLGLFFFLFPRAVEWLNIYISTLVILYILYILLSKTELKVYWTSFIFIFFLIVLLLKGVPSKEFEYRYFKYLNLVLLFFFYQFNCLFFSKHIKFVSLLFPLVIIVFNFLFILRLFFSADSSIALIENTFDNLGLYCIFLALSVIVFSFFSNRSKIPYIKIVSNCIILLVVISVIIFHSRTALILIIAYLILEHLWTKYSNLKCGIGIIAITSVILLLTFFIKNDSTQGRFFIYKTSISIIKDNPVLGIGYCNFPSVFPVYQAAMFQNGKMSEKEIYLADNTMVALNEYIHTTVEFGVFGLSLLLLTIFLILFYGKAFLSIYLCLCIAMFFSYILHSEVIVYLIILLISLSPAPIISKMSRFISIIICAVIIFITGYNINSVIYKKKMC